jgi:cell division septal protein FtsQ
MVNNRYRRGQDAARGSRRAGNPRRRRHRVGGAAESGDRGLTPQFMRRVRNRPALRRRGRLHAMLRVVAVAGVLAAIAYGAQHAVQRALTSPALSIQSVRLHQVPTMLIEPVRARLGPAYGQNLLAVDLLELRRSIEELPAVRSAGIRRVLPDGLVVSVEARRPAVRVLDAAGSYDIDAEGFILDIVDPRASRPLEVRLAGRLSVSAAGLQVTTDPAHGKALRSALAVLRWLDEPDRPLTRPIEHLRIDRVGIVMVLSSALEIVVGDERRLDAKMAAVRNLLRANPPSEPTLIDARYADMLVVRRLEAGPE